MSNVPAVMVSSTFYDLRQVRNDLGHFIEHELGYRALLSEYSSFPVDPDFDTVENCRRRVEKDADILVLVIGGRYGYVEPNSKKSITNLEYFAARAKGIPVYAFVEKSVLALLPVWERSPEADFSHAVSDPRVFEFIGRVRSVDRAWMHEFEYAQDISKILRIQFAHLQKEGLQLRIRLRTDARPYMNTLSGKALRLLLEEPPAFEYLLFAQVLQDEVDAVADLRREHQLKLVFGAGDQVPDTEAAVSWMGARMQEVRRLADAFNLIMGDQLQKAFGPPGVHSDIDAVVFSARQMGGLYRNAIEWS
jgi:hypothetical protein